MTAATYDIQVERGTTLRLAVVPKHDGVPYDLTDVTAVLDICQDGMPLITPVVGPEAGTIHLHLPPAVTQEIAGSPRYNLLITYPTGDVHRLLRGRLVVVQ